jgi:hypothetical protein
MADCYDYFREVLYPHETRFLLGTGFSYQFVSYQVYLKYRSNSSAEK